MSVTQASLLGDTFGSKASGTIPIGGIIMWSGSIASVPTGWSICNGANGTPNLVDRFIVGAGSGYAVAATGGSADATLVSHSHTISGSTDSEPNHIHIEQNYSTNGSGDGPGPGASCCGGSIESSGVETQGGGAHFHSVSGNTSIEGSSATNANLPPYYALAFIMRTS